jgi:hypothetical protein
MKKSGKSEKKRGSTARDSAAFKIKLRGKDNAPLSMRKIRDGPLALLIGAEDFPYSPVIACNASIELGQFRLQFPHKRADHLAEAVIVVPYDEGEATPKLRDVAGNDNPMLGQKATRSRSLPDEPGRHEPRPSRGDPATARNAG